MAGWSIDHSTQFLYVIVLRFPDIITRTGSVELFFSLSGFCCIFGFIGLFFFFSFKSHRIVGAHFLNCQKRREKKKQKNYWKLHLWLLVPANLDLLRVKLTQTSYDLVIHVFKLFPGKHQLTLKCQRFWKRDKTCKISLDIQWKVNQKGWQPCSVLSYLSTFPAERIINCSSVQSISLLWLPNAELSMSWMNPIYWSRAFFSRHVSINPACL